MIELNRAVALGTALGPETGSPSRGRAGHRAVAARLPLLASVRGDLFTKLGRVDEARAELERAAVLTANVRERDLLPARAVERGRS
jgi:predicted RNA polymerase sigma factor